MPRTSSWTPERDGELRAQFASGKGMRAAARAMGLSFGQISGRSRVLRLHFTPAGEAVPLRADHPAATEGRTLFPSRVTSPDVVLTVLKPGDNQRKLGRTVEKGPWRGMAIYSLTLEERASCPRSCAQWLWCYGNAMPFAQRIEPGPGLEAAIEHELRLLSRAHPRGFVVRLHVLGDFYSLDYVRHWAGWLDRFPALHVFGYTARHPATPVGGALRRLAAKRWDRFAIRLSCGTVGARRAIVVKDAAEACHRGAIVCPAQTGATSSCATCGLCWAGAASDKTIAFLRHGMAGGRRAA